MQRAVLVLVGFVAGCRGSSDAATPRLYPPMANPPEPPEALLPDGGAAPKFGDVDDVLRHAKSAELYRLRPHAEDDQAKPTDARFHDYAIVSKQVASDPQRAADAILSSVAPPGSAEMLCFNPRHALRISDGTRTIDLLLCYECLQVDVYEGDTQIDTKPIRRRGQALLESVYKASAP